MNPTKTQRRRHVYGALLGVSAGLLVVLVVVLVVRTYTIIDVLRTQQIESAQQLDLLTSNETNRQTAVVSVQEFTAYAIACADKPGVQDVASILACVQKTIRQENGKPR